MNQNGSVTKPVAPTPVAIIGMGCLFPKADGLGRYWANIRDRVDAISDVPETHWRAEDYFDADPKAPDHTYARRGGFLSPVDFPALDFGIAPNNLEATDTTQLLGLLVARQALEDAGYGAGRPFDRDRVSVILGVTGTLELVIPLGARLGHPIWRRALKTAGVPDDTAETVVQQIADSYVGWQENSFPGLLGNVAAGRIANRLDLGGTNCVIDAACASSLGALNLALLELAAGRSDMVLTGGLDTFNDIFMYMCFSKTPALSPSGDARPFDGSADGTILGEGLGVVVLKRLEDARRDGDRVYAVIKSVGSSSDGKGGAVYAPKADGQAKALRQAYSLAGVTPATIELVEAHGTGTKVGDAAEVAALTEVYREARAEGSWCTLGSVKSQIGHAKAAAGAAGLIKAALALYHKVLPPTAKVERPAEGLTAGASPFLVNSEPRPWLPSAEHPRRAAVSAFGFGGSNFHCVLEEADPSYPGVDWDGDVQIAAFSGPNREALHAALVAWEMHSAWSDVCAAAAISRDRFRPDEECRLLMVVDRSSDVARRLRDARSLLNGSEGKTQTATTDGTYFGQGPRAGSLGLVFPGQGSQYVGMLRELACRFPALTSVLADANAAGDGSARLSDIIYPPSAYSDEERAGQEAALRATQSAQPAIGAVSLGALAVLEHFGVRAEVVAGHSFGELTALCAAGRFQPIALHRLAGLRGRAMAEREGERGAMLAVLAPIEQVEELVRSEKLDLVMANKNGPRQSVLSGPSAEIERAAQLCTERGITARVLPVSAAFHSRFVAEASVSLLDALRTTEVFPARIPVFANATAAEYPADADEARSLLASQLARPVEFMAEIEALYDRGVRTFLEVGPDAKLTGLVGSILEGRDHTALALDASRGRRGNLIDLARTLATLAAGGYPVELRRWQEGVVATGEASRPKPSFTVKVSGANIGPKATPAPAKTSIPQRSVSAAPTQDRKPVSPPEVSSASRRNGKHPEPPMTYSNGEPRHASKSNAKPATAPPRPEPPALVPVPLGTADPALLTQALQNVQENLLALQQISAQTAEVHRQFLEGQDRAQFGFQTLLEQQQRLTCAALGMALPDAPKTTAALAPMPARAVPPIRQPAPPPVPSAAPPSQAAQEPPRVPAPPAPRAQEPAAPVVERAVPSPASPSGRETVQRVLIEVVSEKTGYPAEMLEPAMQLDADLGIDSIKRVEILSAIQERLPEAPVIKPEHLGSLRTLGDIIDFLAQGETPSPASSAAGSGAIRTVLIEVVSEKTGYPCEMLEPAMQLDADLGIDSIKRVEILSAIQERLPEAPVIKPEHLG
ncbi:MAG: beta-ketoacyl synthase N-terminal-like domain-containing protein, partial [Isosphaeraceae bacterium]|nr:beta-ketoacyl synthase N-terminal-like domain-containing protein [Isosphaeraceae bacterium]